MTIIIIQANINVKKADENKTSQAVSSFWNLTESKTFHSDTVL